MHVSREKRSYRTLASPGGDFSDIPLSFWTGNAACHRTGGWGRQGRRGSVLGARALRVMPRGAVVGGLLGNAGLVAISWVPDPIHRVRRRPVGRNDPPRSACATGEAASAPHASNAPGRAQARRLDRHDFLSPELDISLLKLFESLLDGVGGGSQPPLGLGASPLPSRGFLAEFSVGLAHEPR